MSTGIWNAGDAEHHQTSEKLANTIKKLMEKYQCNSFADFGCGNGYYVNFLNKAGYNGIGIEGNRSGLIYPENVIIRDLTISMILSVDCSISLEVGEHLPKSSQEIFMQNVCDAAAKLLILSWAEIGQPGIGHINCRDQQEVIDDVCNRGFELKLLDTKQARANIDSNCDWFERTLLIFKRI